MDERDWLAERFEEHRTPAAGGGLPDARLAERGRRRRPGGLAAAQPLGRRRRSRTSARWLTTVVARVSLNMLRSRNVAARGAARRPHARPDRRPRRRDRPRARGAAGRLGRPRAARRARDAEPRRAARVRAARHVRRALRRDRADRRPLARGGAPARQPRAPPRPGREHRFPTPTSTRSARSSTRSSRPRATATSTRCVAVLDPDVVLRADLGPAAGGSREVRGAEAVAGQALGYSRLGLVMRPALVNGAVGARLDARRRAVLGRRLHVRDGRIVAIDILADPERLRRLDLTILDG